MNEEKRAITTFTIFKVGRGQCCFLWTPNDYGVLFDCGGEDAKVINALAEATKNKLKGWNGHPLSFFVLSHPHQDHISDIKNLHRIFKPSIIHRRRDLDWKRVKRSNMSNEEFNFYRANFFPPEHYNIENPPMPDWGMGMTINNFAIYPIKKIEELSGEDDSKYVNNSSIVSVVKIGPYTIAIGGDMLTDGMKTLLEYNNYLAEAIVGGIDFFLTPHHGHESGFSKEWFHITGPTRIFNIASERRKRPTEDETQVKVSNNYSQDSYCNGYYDGEKKVKLLTTKNGTIQIIISIDTHGNWDWRQR